MSLSEEAIAQLESAGLKVFVVKMHKTLMKHIQQLSNLDVLQEITRGRKIVANMKAKVEEVLSKVKDVEPKKC